MRITIHKWFALHDAVGVTCRAWHLRLALLMFSMLDEGVDAFDMMARCQCKSILNPGSMTFRKVGSKKQIESEVFQFRKALSHDSFKIAFSVPRGSLVHAYLQQRSQSGYAIV